MRVAKRICAFALALTIAFLSVGYEPPKAKAVVAETATAASILATYLAATGMPLMVIEGGAAAASAGTASLISGYAAATGGTVEVITTSIAAGATIGTGGVIILSVAAVALLAGITAWVIDEYGLIGEDDKPVTEPVPIIAPPMQALMADGSYLPVYIAGDSSTNFAPVDGALLTMPANAISEGGTYAFGSGAYLHIYPHSYYTSRFMGQFYPPGSSSPVLDLNSKGDVGGGWLFGAYLESDGNYYVCIFDYLYDGTYWSTHRLPYDACRADVVYGCEVPGSVSLSLDPDYAPKPELAPDTQVVLNPNLAPEFYPDSEPAPDALSEAIFEKLANGDFAPQYTEEPVSDPDDGTADEPSTGTDLSGVLGWLEAIWNAIKSLVEAIGDKLMQLFVPSEEYMEALPEALTDAFAERTGFLTYPMSLLFGFVDLIATPAGDFILEWDDVYEPFSRGKLISAGQFNVTQYVNSNQALSNVYSLWKTVVSGYLIFMFFDLCYKKYNAIVRDRLG